jgi:hypothetical protein
MPELVHVVDRLGNTTFALRPEFDATVLDLGYEPPVGVPVECTWEWAWDAAEQKVAREQRQEARKTRPAKAAPVSTAGASEPRKAPAKRAARSRTRRGTTNG